MKTARFVLMAAAIAVLGSCAKEMVSNKTTSNGITQISASFADGDDKTVLGGDGTSVLWSPHDEICVFYNGDGVKFSSINSVPKATTLFLSSGTVLIGTAEDGSRSPYLYGVYPYSAANAQDGEEITMTVPTAQTAVEGSFGRGTYPCIGRSKDTNIAFYNVCGGIRFTLSQNGIRKIVLTGNNNETLAGKVKVKFDENGKPKVAAVVNGEKNITLIAPNGGEFQTGKWYYISVLPVNLTSGFSFEFIKGVDENIRGTRDFTSSKEIKRSVFGSIENADSGVEFIQAPVTTKDASEVKYSAATLNGTFNVSGAESVSKSVFFLYSDTESTLEGLKTNGIKVNSSLSGSEFKSSVNNLKYVQKYHYVAAVTFSGQTYYGDVKSFATIALPDGPVDLGLSVKWASVNIGASKPMDYGDYYAWGEIETKNNYSWPAYKWCKGSSDTLTKYNTDSSCGTVDNKTVLEPEDDVAHVKLGGKWRMPTDAEWTELRENCTWEGTTIEGVNGRLVTSKKTGYTNKSIFLPAAGYREGTSLGSVGSGGNYWSSSLDTDYSDFAMYAYFDSDGVYGNGTSRYDGFSVRPVSE